MKVLEKSICLLFFKSLLTRGFSMKFWSSNTWILYFVPCLTSLKLNYDFLLTNCRYIEEILESTLNLFSIHQMGGPVGTSSQLSPIHFIALIDPKAQWFIKWMVSFQTQYSFFFSPLLDLILFPLQKQYDESIFYNQIWKLILKHENPINLKYLWILFFLYKYFL